MVMVTHTAIATATKHDLCILLFVPFIAGRGGARVRLPEAGKRCRRCTKFATLFGGKSSNIDFHFSDAIVKDQLGC